LIALDTALATLKTVDPRAARVVELRFFGGLREPEIAEMLGVSVMTVKRDWKAARAWLVGRLQSRENTAQRN
jgi:RNA polymerase sigma factor (sigma-70 family)